MKKLIADRKTGLVLATSPDILASLTDRLHNAGIQDVQSYHSMAFSPGTPKNHTGSKEGLLTTIINTGNGGKPFYVALAFPGNFRQGITWEHLNPEPKSPLVLYDGNNFRLVNPQAYTPVGNELGFYKGFLASFGIRFS